MQNNNNNSNTDLDLNDPKVQEMMKKCMAFVMQNMNNGNMNNMNMNNMNMNNMNMMNMMNNMYNNNMNGMNFNNMNMNMMNMMMNNMYNNNNMFNNIATNFGNMNNPNINMNNNNMANSMNNLGQNNNNFNVQNNNNINNMAFSSGNVNTINNVNNNQEPKELLPRNDKVMKDNTLVSNNGNQPIVNIAFDASTGSKVIISAPKNTTIKDLIKQYIKKINISENHIGKDIIFLFNGEKMNPHSEKTLQDFPFFAVITVFDQNNVIGA